MFKSSGTCELAICGFSESNKSPGYKSNGLYQQTEFWFDYHVGLELI